LLSRIDPRALLLYRCSQVPEAAQIIDLFDAREHLHDERPLQEFLGSRPGMLSQQLGTGCRWVIPLPMLSALAAPPPAPGRSRHRMRR
jgi:hypothetical protein